MPRKARADAEQIAALAVRLTHGGKLRVLLVTSRESRRWVIPKGWPMQGKAAWDAARIEAREEAGVTGQVAHEPIGRYHYRKRLPGGKRLECRVTVFPMLVRKELPHWKEMRERRRRWVSPRKAAKMVQEKDLSRLFLELRRKAGGVERIMRHF